MNNPRLKAGCYLMSFRPTTETEPGMKYVGTFRVTHDSLTSTYASGDLYAINNPDQIKPSELNLTDIPNLRSVTKNFKGIIPTFPVSAYRHYLDVHQVTESESGVTLDLQAHKFDQATGRLIPGTYCQLRLAGGENKDKPTFTGELIGPNGKRGDFFLQH